MDLPNALKYVIESKAEEVPVQSLLKASEAITKKYRNDSGQGKRLVSSDIDILTYAIVRMPATYGAVASSLRYTLEMAGLEIKSVLDVGAGTGTAAWAAAQQIPDVEEITCVEREPSMIRFGKALMQGSAMEEIVNWVQADMCAFQPEKKYDLVIASYSLNELTHADRMCVVNTLWNYTNQVLLIIEPGTPEAFAHMKVLRSELLSQGANMVAPCPHGMDCPMGAEDWCHFSCRISRSKLHKMLKGGDVPYEDEKYTYLAVSAKETKCADNRILRHPQIESGKITLQVCTQHGIKTDMVTKKQKEQFKVARKAKAGDVY